MLVSKATQLLTHGESNEPLEKLFLRDFTATESSEALHVNECLSSKY